MEVRKSLGVKEGVSVKIKKSLLYWMPVGGKISRRKKDKTGYIMQKWEDVEVKGHHH